MCGLFKGERGTFDTVYIIDKLKTGSGIGPLKDAVSAYNILTRSSVYSKKHFSAGRKNYSPGHHLIEELGRGIQTYATREAKATTTSHGAGEKTRSYIRKIQKQLEGVKPETPALKSEFEKLRKQLENS